MRFLGALDHAGLAGPRPSERIDHGTCDGHALELLASLLEAAAGLEDAAQKLIGRDVADAPPGIHGVRRQIEDAQPAMTRAASQRRLVDRSREASRRQSGEHAHIARPGDAEELASRPTHPRHFDVTAHPGKRPVQCAGEPGLASDKVHERFRLPLDMPRRDRVTMAEQ